MTVTSRSWVPALALLLALCPHQLRGQQSGRDSGSRPLESFFALSVGSLAESARWYKDKLGFVVASEVPDRVVILRSGGIMLELIHDPGAVPLKSAARAAKSAVAIHGITKVGWVVDDFDATVSQLRARRVDIAYGPFPKRPGEPANVIVRDNAGNMIQLFGR